MLLTGLALAVVFGALSWRSPAARADSGPPIPYAAQPYGLLALEQYPSPGCDSKSASCPAHAALAVASKNPAISGLMIRVPWKDMEPSEGTINWQITQDMFNLVASGTPAQPHGTTSRSAAKFVVLSFVPGFETPDWVLKKGVQTATFCVPYGRGAGAMQPLPLPWDTTYQSEWSSFLKAVASQYASNPAFLMITASGPTSVSAEMGLPGAEGTKNTACTSSEISNDIKTWEKLKYSPDLYEQSWNTAFQDFGTDFPNQYTSLALYPGLPIANPCSGPLIECILHPPPPADTEIQATPASIITEGTTQLHGNFAVEVDNLTYKSASGQAIYDDVSGYSGVRGWEMAGSAVKDPETEGNVSDPATALQTALQAGVNGNADFLEVYEDDVDPATLTAKQQADVQKALVTIAGELPLPTYFTLPPGYCYICH